MVILITESVDSVCRDTTYTQYMPIQKISPNLRNGTLISLYDHIPFMTNKTPRVAKTRRKSTTPGTRKTGKLFFFLLSSDKLAHSISHDNFRTKQQHFQLSSATSHRFFATSKSSPGGCSCPLNNYGFVCHAIFTLVRMRT